MSIVSHGSEIGQLDRRTMNVSSTTGVVTGEDSLKLDNTISVTSLDSAQESGVEVAGVGRISVAAGGDARVDTL